MLVGFKICVVFMTLRENWKSIISAEFSDRIISYPLCLLTVGFCTRCNFHTEAHSVEPEWKLGAGVCFCLVEWLLCFGPFAWPGGLLFLSFF